CLAQNLFISPPTLPQIAASAAFDCADELEANVRRYGENRALLLKQLPRAGFDRLAPADGAFYIYADVSRLTNDTAPFSGPLPPPPRAPASTPGRAIPSAGFPSPDRRPTSRRRPTACWRGGTERRRLLDQPLPPTALGWSGRGLIGRFRRGDCRGWAISIAVGRPRPAHSLRGVRPLPVRDVPRLVC